ncbi:hypothetical protein [Paenibacillus sp. DRB1-1]|uniref:hypothetical protein n=1 Tax=Paenibacillus sp. DRB1-1 TaxID=3422309 RepID=UPI003F9905C5
MSRIKRKYRTIRQEFKNELYAAIRSNPALGMLCIKTYTASRHRDHIHQIWGMSVRYPNFRKEYTEKLIGKCLTGRDEIFHSLYFAAPDLYQKYARKIPEDLAMGDALGVAYRAMKDK